MKRTIFALFLSLSIIFLSLSILTQPLSSGNTNVSIKEIESFTYCSLSHKGPFSEIAKIIKQLMQFSQNQRINPAGPLFGIYHSNPEEVKDEDLQWEIGFPVTEQTFVQAPLQKKQWNFTPVATALHVGPYEKSGETYTKIFEWMEANNYVQVGPSLEKYMDMFPSQVDPGKLRTEIWIPCKKKSNKP